MSRSERTLATTMVVVALSNWSCGSTAPDSTPVVDAIVVNPASSTITLNAQIPLQAQVQDTSGAIIPDAAVTWTVEDPRIISVSADGIVTALAVGTSKVAANALGKSGLATITVSSPAPVRVDLSPASATIQSGQSKQLVASPRDAGGNVVAGKTVTWSSDNGAVAAVNGGLVTTAKAGVATITASVGSVRGTATITVTPGPATTILVAAPKKNLKAGWTMQLAATAMDKQGNTVPGQTFYWSSSNASVAAVSSSGVVTGKRSGTATITASTALSGATRGSVQIDVK